MVMNPVEDVAIKMGYTYISLITPKLLQIISNDYISVDLSVLKRQEDTGSVKDHERVLN